MDKIDKIEQDIRKTLDQFNDAEQLPPNPWFSTRVMTQLEKQQDKKTVFSAFLKPALLMALVALNLGTALWYLSDSEDSNQSSDRQQLIEMLSGDLKPNSNQSTFILEE